MLERVTLWLYRVLLRAFPRAFRERYGAAMVAVLAERLSDARAGGSSLTVLSMRALADGLLQLFLERSRRLRRGTRVRTSSLTAVSAGGGGDGVGSQRRWARGQKLGRGVLAAGSDLRHAVRQLGRHPAQATAAIVVLAVGMGMTTAVVTVVDALIVRGLPYRNADRLVELWTGVQNGEDRVPGLTTDAAVALRAAGGLFEAVEGGSSQSMILLEGDVPETWQTARVTPGLFSMLGSTPRLGRSFASGSAAREDASAILIAEHTWRQRFGGDPHIVGRRLRFDGQTYEVIGVMPSTFAIPAAETQAWLPLAEPLAAAGVRGVWAMARMRPGVTLAAAQRWLDGLSQSLRGTGVFASGQGYAIETMEWHEAPAPTRVGLLILLGAVVLLLGISCANVAALALRRATDGRNDIAVRAALGAGRMRLLSERLADGVVLGVAGAIPGVLLARWLVEVMVRTAPAQLRLLESGRTPAIDLRVLAFAGACALVAGLLATASPAWFAARTDPTRVLRSGGGQSGDRSTRAAAATLVALQVALGLTLVTGSALLLNSFVRLERVNPGYDADRVVSVTLQLPRTRYGTPGAIESFVRSALDALRALPGVSSATTARLAPPLASMGVAATIETDDRGPGALAQAGTFIPFNEVGPDYFAVLGIRLLAGRAFGAGDIADSNVIIVNETMAKRLWPSGGALGRRMRVRSTESWRTVVGVAADTRQIGLDDPLGNDMEYYLPATRGRLIPYVTLLLRTDLPLPALAAAVRERVRSIDPVLPVDQVANLGDSLRATLARRRFFLSLVTLFALAALTVTVVGIHGTVAWAVSRRTREIGIRLALGERAGHVVTSVVAQSLQTVAIGAAGGLLTALALSRFLASLLYGVSARDPLTVLTATAGFVALSAGASAWAARRAAGIDPARAIRSS